jgi:hypothetical protein
MKKPEGFPTGLGFVNNDQCRDSIGQFDVFCGLTLTDGDFQW